MGYHIPGRRSVSRRGGLPGRARKTRYSKPASVAPRWLLGRLGFWLALPGLDAAYQRQLLTLSHMRRAVADVATSCKRLELQVGQLEQEAGELADQIRAGTEAGQGSIASEEQARADTPERLASVRRQYAAMQPKEERVLAASRRLQIEIDALRTGKEAVEAAYTAAEQAAEAACAEVTVNADAGAGGAAP